MCFNYKVSLLTFFTGIIFSLLLIKYGNKKYEKENLTTGIFFIFISFIQFMDFIFWIDLDNKKGLNKIFTITGPILNIGQPLILYIIKLIVYNPIKYNIFYVLINFVYLIVFIIFYYNFILNNYTNLITTNINGHIKWKWYDIKYYYIDIFYLILLFLNIFYLFNFKYALILFIIIYFFLLLSYKLFYYHIGELWCFYGCFIPLLFLPITFII